MKFRQLGQSELRVSQISTPIVEQLEAFAQVIREGKVRYIGLSNETAWGVAEFSRVAARFRLPKVVSIQNAYSLLNRTFDSALAEASRREDITLSPETLSAIEQVHARFPNPAP
jgi:aryl-alcohol dehydrogenase-like predicted oxidoreductase